MLSYPAIHASSELDLTLPPKNLPVKGAGRDTGEVFGDVVGGGTLIGGKGGSKGKTAHTGGVGGVDAGYRIFNNKTISTLILQEIINNDKLDKQMLTKRRLLAILNTQTDRWSV